MHYKRLESPTYINAKILVIDLNFILSLILGLRDEKNAKGKSYF